MLFTCSPSPIIMVTVLALLRSKTSVYDETPTVQTHELHARICVGFCNVPPLRCVNAFGIFSINGVAYETKGNSQDKIASPQKCTSPVALNRSFASHVHIGVLNCQISVARN